MAIDDIVKSLENEGEKERERLLKAAEQEAKRIVELAKEDAKQVKEKEMERVSLLLKGETARIYNQAELYRKEEIIRAKEQVIDKAFEKVKLQAKDLKSSGDYVRIFENLAREAFERIQGDVVISVDKRDEEIARKVLSKLGKDYRLRTDLDCLGGLVVKSADERVVYLNTIDSRMEKARNLLKSEITEALFSS